jgi:mRNA-degrading endonuclease RelE of RelBE toxin-antitoxin system
VYTAFFSQDFCKQFGKLVKKDAQLRQRVESKTRDIMEDPFRNSEELVAAFKGKRRIYIGKAGYRLIYCVCRECRGKGYSKINSCLDCDGKNDDAIVFFDILHRSTAYGDYWTVNCQSEFLVPKS